MARRSACLVPGAAPLLAAWLLAGPAAALELTALEAAGKRLYREGIAPGGRPLAARVGPQGTTVPGPAAACAGCHGADGRGRPEGGLRPPPVAWEELARPDGHRHGDGGRTHPPFDIDTFYRAVSEGLDPAGNRLDPAMPRYALARSDAAALAAYLRRIGEDRDPGISPAVLRIGTLLPRSGPLAEAGGLVEQVLRGVLDRINGGGGIHGRRLELVVEDAGGEWRERLARADVFALVSPLAPGLHRGLPSHPETAPLPVVGPLAGEEEGEGGSRIFRIWPGEREQGRALAEFAARSLGLDASPVALVVPEDRQGLAAAVEAQLARHGWRRVSRRPPGDDAAAVAEWQAGGVEAVFYFGPAGGFSALRKAAAAAGWKPAFLAPLARAGAAGAGEGERIFLAAPALPREGDSAGRREFEEMRRRRGLPERHLALQAAAYAAAAVLAEGLRRSGRGASREGLVEALEGLQGYDTGVTPPLAFGPGRRVGLPGAHILAPAAGRLRPAGPFVGLD